MTGTASRRTLVGLIVLLCGALGCRKPEPPPPWTSVAVRGNHEATLLDDGRLIPVFASTRDPLGLCIQALPEVDTSQWQARIWWDSGDDDEFAPAANRMAGTVCFERELTPDTRGKELEACAQVRDSFDQSSWSVPCSTVRVLPDDAPYASLRQDLNGMLGADPPSPLLELLASLDSLAERSNEEGFPFMALRIRLVAAFYERTRGGPGGRAAAAERLASLPAWIEQASATKWAAQVEQELHAIETAADKPNWSRMWEHLRRASSLFLATADPKRFTVAMDQADLLARAGSVTRAIETLRSALDECAEAPCFPSLLGPARSNLAWLLLTDPLAGEAGWAEAEAILDDLLNPAKTQIDGTTRATRLLNRAYLHLRQGRPLISELEEVRALLSSEEASNETSMLTQWADLLDGESALDEAPQAALECCERALAGAETARLAAWAAGCVAESHRRAGGLRGAAAAYELTLTLHENASPASLDQDLAVDVGRRADDFYRAARVAVERDRPSEAWSLLERLDSLSVGGDARACDEGRAGEDEKAAARALELAQQLARLGRPASLERERQLEPVIRRLRQELAELLRRQRCGDQSTTNARLPGLRAVPLEDEILLLQREETGAVRLVRRTPIARTTVTRIAGELGSAVRRSGVEDAEWRDLAGPLATALAPEVAAKAESGAVRGYWLHGSLQGIPLAALPLSTADSGEPGWLGEIALPALYPADLRVVPAPVGKAMQHRTFVVDPSLNLPSGKRLASFYRGMFPQDEVLRGAAATSSAVTRALRSSTWLHIDAHGIYDPAFPELSHLVLADGDLGLATLGGLSTNLEGANLLGCWTGAWPVTSDGGRHGMAGALARAGVPWTIASRTAVVDELAADFNEAFYPALEGGSSVPLAYASAMSVVRESWPASQWAAIMLVAGGPRAPDSAAAEGPRSAGAAP